jgi:hypothetical protein
MVMPGLSQLDPQFDRFAGLQKGFNCVQWAFLAMTRKTSQSELQIASYGSRMLQ